MYQDSVKYFLYTISKMLRVKKRKEQLKSGNWAWDWFSELPNVRLLASVERVSSSVHHVQVGCSWFIRWLICATDACWEQRSGKPSHKLFLLPGTSFLGIIHLSRSRLNVTPSVEPSSSKIWFCLHWARALCFANMHYFPSLYHSPVNLGGKYLSTHPFSLLKWKSFKDKDCVHLISVINSNRWLI